MPSPAGALRPRRNLVPDLERRPSVCRTLDLSAPAVALRTPARHMLLHEPAGRMNCCTARGRARSAPVSALEAADLGFGTSA